MSYLVFARKYRPQTFADILGQEPIVKTLTNAVRQRRIGHAYLFTGPRGTGKTSTARIFAKALNCAEGPTVTPCLSCAPCQEIARGGSLDVLEIDGASNRGIDQIRALRELAKFAPASGTFKIYIIDEVHQITAEGFNALLKILEEPPSHVVFILATTAPHKVPATILSRCQRYDFRRLPLQVIEAKLKSIAQEEKLSLAPEALAGIARAAGGSLRDAESLLDQLSAFGQGKIEAQDVRTLLGAIEEEVFVEVVEGIRARDPGRLLKVVAEATDAGCDLIQWSLSLLSFLRNLLVAKVGAGPLGFEDLGQESIERLTQLAGTIDLEELILMAQVMTGAVETMRRVGEPRIPLEVALVRLSTAESLVAISEILERLEKLAEPRRTEPPQTGSLKPIETPQVTVQPQQAALQPPGPSQTESPQVPVSLEQIRSVWSALLKKIHEEKASVAAYLSEAQPVDLRQESPPHLTIGLPKGFEFHKEALNRPQAKGLIERGLESLLGLKVRCSFQIVDTLEKASPAIPEAPALPKDDPALNEVLKLFEGRLLSEETPGSGG